ERDDFSSNRHPALALCLSMIFFGKPVSTFPDHAVAIDCPARHGVQQLRDDLARRAAAQTGAM
ncbi:hypothetical protein, partial [Bradyrhizobium sp. Leo170]|uniref:hypothetical protein n=1 Tax=Bradyrhizobium sp. Leo170 TaxID=1571199 RepID=UPI001A9127D2